MSRRDLIVLWLVTFTAILTLAFSGGYYTGANRMAVKAYDAGFEAGVKDQMAIREKTRLKMDQAGICDYVVSICPLRNSSLPTEEPKGFQAFNLSREVGKFGVKP